MRKQCGLSLIEMMITVAIAAILVTIGAPGIGNILQKNNVVADLNNLSTIARVARFTAIDEEIPVTVCPTHDYTDCSTDWRQAKMVFIDTNTNGSRDTSEVLITSSDALAQGNTIAGIQDALIFNPDGSINQQATVTICPASGNQKLASALIISLYGRVAAATDANNDGIREDADGNNISCT
ncbi:GspH/FimT family pseudopilin [Salinimonas chungwhensis]|jgi:type IV fimbrial biogenesis protein FimT|uniref:GspH/FimT family pseudopilin n=1 Tax=Salinimonas chungwhensis TaxID=265425 RepID=UPI000363893A|nr:GspH/FimT family pseudopilin [Salinimonas chungwhensis]